MESLKILPSNRRKREKTGLLFGLFIAFVILVQVEIASAACSSPAANIGSIDFQGGVHKFCDGTNWQPLGATPSFPLTGPNGTATGPTYSFSAGTNTGMFSTGPGTLAFSTAGSTQLTIDSSGNVGIGTTAPGANLHVQVPDTSWSATYGGLYVGDSTSSGYFMMNDDTASAGQFSPSFEAKPVGSTRPFTIRTKISAGNDSGSTPMHVIDASAGGAAIASRPLLDIQNNTSSKMLITASGNVGIGTTTPVQALQVSGNTSTGVNIVTQNLGTLTTSTSALGAYNDLNRYINAGITSSTYSSGVLNGSDTGYVNTSGSGGLNIAAINAAGVIRFATGGNAAGNERMRIDATGNVGLGTSAPDTKLHVAGSIKMVDGNQGAGRVLTSDANGVGSWSVFPKFFAKRTANQTITGSTYTKMQLDTENFDTTNAFDSVTNYRFQPTVAGYYNFTGTVHNSSGCGAAMYSSAVIYFNGAQLVASAIYVGTGYMLPVQATALTYMNGSSDYVELYVNNNCGTSETYVGSLQGYRAP